MPRLIWSPAALQDMRRLASFLSDKSPQTSSRAVQAIRNGIGAVAQHPEIGRPAEDMEPEFREWLIDFGDSGYVVLYHFDGQTALIVAVRHQKEA